MPAHGMFAASSFLGQVATADNTVHVSMYIAKVLLRMYTIFTVVKMLVVALLLTIHQYFILTDVGVTNVEVNLTPCE
jgi:hypothetical protein